MKTPRIAALSCVPLLLLASGCATRGYPTHGGGKRFSHEQAILAGSIDDAMAQVDFRKVAATLDAQSKNDGKIAVQIYPMSHSGGGVQTSSTGFLGGLLGVGPVLGGGQQAAAAAMVAGAASPGNYMPFGFESADDLRYLMGRLVERLGEQKLRVVQPLPDAQVATLCVLVRELGIDQSDFNALIYNEKKLVARTSVEIFVIGRDPANPNETSLVATPIGKADATWRFREDYFLGFGPLSGGKPEEVAR
jgi:hypothetical protein